MSDNCTDTQDDKCTGTQDDKCTDTQDTDECTDTRSSRRRKGLARSDTRRQTGPLAPGTRGPWHERPDRAAGTEAREGL